MENPFILETKGLSHQFGDGTAVLDHINLQVPEHAIYGFLGANGAGKTTTLRLVLGLLTKQYGEIMLFGKTFTGNRLQALQKIGAMIESPSIYGHLTATENLQVLQKIYMCPQARISQVLEMVGLSGTGTKKAAHFSLGMKQRLSIAMALLHEPGLLILDEPTNGLDPNGMVEIRAMLLELNHNHGTTIVISSHLLAEIEKMVSHIGIIHGGRLLFQGTLAQLQQQRTTARRLNLLTNDEVTAVDILQEMKLGATLTNGRISFPQPEPEVVADVAKRLVNAGVSLYELTPSGNDLEAIFMNMITD